MLALTNPGQLESGFAIDTFTFSVLIAVGAGLLITAVSISEYRRKLRGYFGVAGVIVVFCALIWVAVNVTVASAQRAEAEAAYTSEVREWLDHDYSIEVAEKDTAKLVAGKELAVLIDSEYTAVELVDGTNNTIQVKVVGGHILQPTR